MEINQIVTCDPRKRNKHWKGKFKASVQKTYEKSAMVHILETIPQDTNEAKKLNYMTVVSLKEIHQ